MQASGVSSERLRLAYKAFLSLISVSLYRFSHRACHKKTLLKSYVRKNTSHCCWAGLILLISCLCPRCLCAAPLSHRQTSPCFFVPASVSPSLDRATYCFLCGLIDPWPFYCNVTFCLVSNLFLFCFCFLMSYILLWYYFKLPGCPMLGFFWRGGQEIEQYICYPFLYYAWGKLIKSLQSTLNSMRNETESG